MRCCVLLLLAAVCAGAQAPSERIGTIDFYGYGTVDLDKLRSELPLHIGDKWPADSAKAQLEKTLTEAAGRKARISGVCCLPDGRKALFVGLAEPDAPPLRFNPVPKGDSRLPEEVGRIFADLEAHLDAAVKRGDASEDDSQGYALFSDPACHADQLKLRDWARTHVDVILDVLEDSRFAEQRANAAEALGYVDRSPKQVQTLVDAAFDADSNARNNAIRALEVLCTGVPETVRQVTAERFVPLLHSLDWTDRNKGSLLFMRLIASRDPALLKLLREQALTPLREMAQWASSGHAFAALLILGRMGGISDERVFQMTPSEVLASVR